MKKTISLFLAVLMIFPIFSLQVNAADVSQIEQNQDVFEFAVIPFDTEATIIKWWQDTVDGNYYLFLPTGTNTSNLKVVLNVASCFLDGAEITNGSIISLEPNNEYALKYEEESYNLIVVSSANIPSVYIQTESGSLDYIHADKSNKEKGSFTLVDEDGNVTMSDVALKKIKGRGNSTWTMVKKPYNITFDKKQDLLGMGKAKKWCLLAQYIDKSLLRNSLIYSIANDFGLNYTPEYRAVDLYINGEYLGNYLITESVEVGSERVDINDLTSDNEDANPDIDIEECENLGSGENNAIQNGWTAGSYKYVDIPNDPENITGGYLLELEYPGRYNDEISGFVSNNGQAVVIKEPEYASKAEVEYINSFYNAFEEALYSEDGYNSEGKHFTEYIDIESFAKMYIIEEFAMDLDAGLSSCYLYLDKDSDKLVAAPVWDFDLSLASPGLFWGNLWFYETDSLYVALRYYSFSSTSQTRLTIWNLLYHHDDFRATVSENWFENNETVFSDESLEAFLNNGLETLKASAYMDMYRWNKADYDSTNSDAATKYAAEVKCIADYVLERNDNFDIAFSEDAALLYYDVNGGNGYVANFKIVEVGDSVEVCFDKIDTIAKDQHYLYVSAPDGMVFAGWNTEKDGTGTTYQGGDSIQLTQSVTTLYAIWKSANDDNTDDTTNETPEDTTPTINFLGDIDGDGTVSAADARLALRASVGLEDYKEGTKEFLAADVDNDNKVTAADARLILRASVELETLGI